MTKAGEQQVSAGASNEHAAYQAAAEHNAPFPPAHTPSDEDPPHLTEAQREAFKENAAALEEAEKHLRGAQQKAFARLNEVGINGGRDSVFETCLTCGCVAYVATPHHPSANCRREDCGHSLACHRW